MVNWPFKSLRPVVYGLIGSLIFLLLYFISLINAVLRNDNEPQLVLAFFGFPTSWLFYLIFHPFLEFLGPFGTTSRRVAEWLLLGAAGVLQYWLIGVLVSYLIICKHHGESETERKEPED